jgi:hypothetical protein
VVSSADSLASSHRRREANKVAEKTEAQLLHGKLTTVEKLETGKVSN